jgi:hypothetical protein
MSLEITNPPAPSSPSPPFPNLGDVITTDDVSQKGSGSYKADYVNWCRTMHLLHEHAPGWQFALASAPGGGHVWKAPNGSGYVVGYFISSEGKTTPHFPQAIMDNRNNAVAFDKISARDLTDSHRRCLCTASAAAFGLAWQLWAREEVENPHREEEPKPARSMKKPEKARSMTPEPSPAAPGVKAEDQPIKPDELTLLLGNLEEMEAKKLQTFMQAFTAVFPLPPNGRVSEAITSVKHQTWINDYFKRNA